MLCAYYAARSVAACGAIYSCTNTLKRLSYTRGLSVQEEVETYIQIDFCFIRFDCLTMFRARACTQRNESYFKAWRTHAKVPIYIPFMEEVLCVLV